MSEEKLIRKKKKALNGSNKRAYAEACNDLATYYYKKNRYADALDEYRTEASVCKELGLRMEWGTCNRMIGEMYMLLAEFDKALKYEKRHLAVAKELNNTVEEQRALATLGRIYLLQGQSTSGKEAEESLKAAERAFLKGLALCESLSGKINIYELMDMRSRLLLNIGVCQEYLGNHDKAVDCLKKAINICVNQDIYDVLHQCYTTLALLYSNKLNDYTNSLSCLSKAEEIAKRLQDKGQKLCETLATKADVLCKTADYQSAKQVLVKAWKMKTPDEEERENIESKLKVVAAMCYADDRRVGIDPTNHAELKKIYESLGDGACYLQSYDDAVSNYLKMLEQAELAGESGRQLIPIYVSLYQTYKDMGSYNDALMFLEKEYELIKDEPKEAFTTLYNIAETSYLAKKPYDQIEKACMNARNAAKEWNKRKYEIRALKSLLKYQEEYFELDKMEETQDELRYLGYEDFNNLENSEDESSAGGDDMTTTIGHDIRCEDITDDDENFNEEIAGGTKTRPRKTGVAYVNKVNEKGESLLQRACIAGNKFMLQRLIAQKHPVNVRDFAGWTPLHEAAINGHYEIAQILIDHGAVINDRGLMNFSGQTPLHDAACNGYMEVMLLLLDKGAIPSIKNDLGHTALDSLRQWRSNTVLNKEKEELYKNICTRLQNQIRTAPAEISPTTNLSRRKIDKSPASTSVAKSPVFKKRNVIQDDSDDDIDLSPRRNQPAFPSDESSGSSDEQTVKKKDISGVKEYRTVISALRHRRTSEDLPEVDLKKAPKSALLDPDEVDDEWLDDDMGTNKSKKRKFSDPLSSVTIAKKPTYDSIKDSIENINRIEPLIDINNRKSAEKQKKRMSDIIAINENSSDSNENICPEFRNSWPAIDRELNESKTRDTRDHMRKRWKQQSTLLRAGFQRNRQDDQSSNSGSDSEFNSRNKRLTPTGTFSRKSSGENFNTYSPRKNDISGPFSRQSPAEFSNYSPRKDCFNMMNMNPSVMQPLNVIQPINIVQSNKNGRTMQTQILPPAAVKVQVEDKVLLISLKLDMINKQTISWLVDEVKTRYYKLTGVRPVFSLMTSDGAILSEDDPLSLVLSSPELKTCITNWKASPAEERYLECCEALGISPCEEIQQTIGRSHTTHRLALGARTLPPSQIRPLFRALTHQSHITAIMLSDNNLGDDGVKYLTDCMCTMKQLTHLDISRNNISAEGARLLTQMFDKASRPVCQLLDYLDISGNPITDEGLKHILKLTTHIRLKSLKLNSCGLTENAAGVINECNANLNALEAIDISNNDVKLPTVSCLVSTLNPNMLMELDLDSVGVQGQAVGCIASFMDSAKELKIRRFSLSNCKLVDGQFMRVFRSLGRAKNLQSVSLKSNLLTFITLKKLLQRQPPVPQINLQGCQDIFKYSPDSDFQVWLPAIDFGRCIPEINVTPVSNTDAERDSFKSFSKTWLSCFKGRGVIEHCEGGVIRFTAR
ncbi:tonsoku-like protein [Leguminivora glycinivorella]|uniref:tonsoku-like protein n=1 Tax=Leguminivora glycinivorella TaxID=1035111 RepID=UPI00200CABE8|nr:tonsoku-like protein [Leguminivora glycinivorella]